MGAASEWSSAQSLRTKGQNSLPREAFGRGGECQCLSQVKAIDGLLVCALVLVDFGGGAVADAGGVSARGWGNFGRNGDVSTSHKAAGAIPRNTGGRGGGGCLRGLGQFWAKRRC